MSGLSPYLTFYGNCREAMTYYETHLGASITSVRTYEGSPMAKDPSDSDKILHATFELNGVSLMASDADGAASPGSPRLHLSLNPTDPELAKQWFEALAHGGEVQHPFQKTFWNAMFGMVVDRFGIPWMINCPLNN